MLAGKVLIVTGASQGIGQVTAFGFARAGRGRRPRGTPR